MFRKRSEAENSPVAAERGGKPPYGWVVAVASGVANFAAGSFQYSFGVFIIPLINNFGWSRAAISGCVTTRYITGAVFAPIAGYVSDRYGPRRFILIGVLIVGLSYMLASRVSSLWQLYIFLGFLTGAGIMFFSIPAVTTVTRWFGRKSALANGIVFSGYSVAQIILPPVATYLILQYSWETCFVILGIAAAGLGSVSWHLIRMPPGVADRLRSKSGEQAIPEAAEKSSEGEEQYTLSSALRAKAFWVIFLIYMVGCACHQMVIIHIVAAANDIGVTLEAAAIILTLAGVTNTLGRLTLGGLASKIGDRVVLTLCLATQALVLFFVAGASELYVFYIVVPLYGFVY